MPSDQIDRRDAGAALSAARRPLIVAHINPDGDALGSLAAAARIAASRGADPRLLCVSPIPRHLSWLNLPAPLVESVSQLRDWEPDLVVFVDCADAARAGREMEGLVRNGRFRDGCPVLCVDHHPGNPRFGAVNWIEPGYAATGQMVGDLALDLGLPLVGPLGEAVYLALVSDTGNFSFTNTTPSALRMAAGILESGLNLPVFLEKYENNWSVGQMRLWGTLMCETRLECDGRVAVAVVTDDQMRRYDASWSDLENFASWLRRLEGVQVVLFTRPSGQGSKISLRSMGDVDVRQVAAQFGGGGHKAAAGVTLDDSPEGAARRVLHALGKVVHPKTGG